VRDKISNRSAIDHQRMNEMQPTISVVIVRSQRVARKRRPGGSQMTELAMPIRLEVIALWIG
jgi:hypothetical protein